jgi:allantoin racemase
MKLWYQSLSRHDAANPYRVALEKLLRDSADPGTTIEVHSIVEAAGIADDYRAMEFLNTREVVMNSAEAERAGCDAFLIGNMTDGGLRESRELVNIPVLGLAETCYHLACVMGANFGLITVNDKYTPRMVENIQRYGLERRMSTIVRLRSDPQALKLSFADPLRKAALLAQFDEAARTAGANGAEVLIPCGGVLMALLASEGIFEVEKMPVINGVIELVKFAEMAVKVRALTGRFTSKRLIYAPPHGETLAKIREFHGLGMYPGAK